MAYSSYGGYVFRNGESRLDRCDAVMRDGVEKTVPGLWPGFAFAAQGMPFEEIRDAIWENPRGHVLLGDGPLLVGLYKQSDVWVWIDRRQIDLVKHGVDLPEEAFMTEKWDGTPIDPKPLLLCPLVNAIYHCSIAEEHLTGTSRQADCDEHGAPLLLGRIIILIGWQSVS